ncbi:squalene--hopene cyclase [Streptomyces sp. NPDC004126]|uniref:squalene--hopene cyclase n=1 Tax=Streptomyces sp. NPDC004126 TaxID=3390695 RepID=UPI003D08CEA4
MSPMDDGVLRDLVRAAVGRAQGRLLALQAPQGWWKGEQNANITMDAEDLLFREFLGVRTTRQTSETARWIRSQQSEDGSWPVFRGGPGDLSTTVEGYVALRLAGDGPAEPHMCRAAARVRERGGIAASRVFTRMWMALFGLWPWRRLPVLPPELVLLPRGAPLNMYDWAYWARQTVLPLTAVSHFRPVRTLPFTVPELHAPAAPSAPRPPSWSLPGAFLRLDSLLRLWEDGVPHRHKPLRRRALRAAERWILLRQDADGSWGGLQPPWVYSVLALHLLGYPLHHPALRSAVDGIDAFTIREELPGGTVRRIEGCQGPVWDTALALVALLDSGLAPGHPAVTAAARWLLGQEARSRGDWCVRRPELQPGGWAFEFHNAHYPDVDDSAEVVLALGRAAPADPSLAGRSRAAQARAVNWVLGMQSRDGGWGAFDADGTSVLVGRLPFCDFGEVTDPPSADVTAHAVEMLCAQGRAGAPATRRAVRYLLASQEADGSWFGRWGVNHVYGTGAVLPALAAAGLDGRHPAMRRGADWLVRHQNTDGGWGEDPRSYDDPAWTGRGTSTPSQTAWALPALLAAGRAGGTPVERGVRHLVTTQRGDGGWDEEQYTGTGFPGDFYIRYHSYRDVFPLTALGRYLAAPADAEHVRA